MCSEPFIFNVFPFSDVFLKKFYMRTLEWNDELKKYFFYICSCISCKERASAGDSDFLENPRQKIF